MVSSYWGDAWATRLSEQYSFDARAFSFVLSAVLLLGPALIIGYGGGNTVSYTHLDVYKRQPLQLLRAGYEAR